MRGIPRGARRFIITRERCPKVSRFEVSQIAGRGDERFTEVKVFGRQLVRQSTTKTIAGDEAPALANVAKAITTQDQLHNDV